MLPENRLPHHLPGTTKFCECVYKRDLMDNLRRGWAPLTQVKERPTNSPVVGKTQQNIWLRAETVDLKIHLRAAVLQRSPRWRFNVITDADLMTTWLYSANEVFDADVGAARLRGENNASRVSDLVEPYDLLVIRLGYKAARNVATPEVFMEALLHREHLGLHTWVVDTPNKPLRQSHRAWDEEVQEHMDSYFEFIEIGAEAFHADPVRGIATHVEDVLADLDDSEPEESGGSDVLDEDGRVARVKKDWRNS